MYIQTYIGVSDWAKPVGVVMPVLEGFTSKTPSARRLGESSAEEADVVPEPCRELLAWALELLRQRGQRGQ